MKTAVMVASASRQQQDDEFICEQEREEQANLWQVLFSLFGNRFDFPVLG